MFSGFGFGSDFKEPTTPEEADLALLRTIYRLAKNYERFHLINNAGDGYFLGMTPDEKQRNEDNEKQFIKNKKELLFYGSDSRSVRANLDRILKSVKGSDKEKNTMLDVCMQSMEYNHLDITAILIKTLPDEYLDKLLDNATHFNRITIMTILLDRGTDPNRERIKDGYRLETPLERAFRRGNVEAARLLLNRDFIPSASAVKAAVYSRLNSEDRVSLVKLLLDKGVTPDPSSNIFRYVGCSPPLIFSGGKMLNGGCETDFGGQYSNSSKEIIKLLIAYGVEGATPAQIAAVRSLELSGRNANHARQLVNSGMSPQVARAMAPYSTTAGAAGSARRSGLMAMRMRANASRNAASRNAAARDATVARNRNIERRTGISSFSGLEAVRALSLTQKSAANRAKANFKLSEAPKGGRRKRRATQKRRR